MAEQQEHQPVNFDGDEDSLLAANVNQDYTEFGIKIHKLRLTLKVHKRRSVSAGSTDAENASDTDGGNYPRVRLRSTSRGRRRPRAGSSTSSMVDSLRNLDLDSNAGSRRPVITATTTDTSSTRLANWEFQGFYSSPRTSTPSSGYSSAAVSRTSSFSSEAASRARSSRLNSAEDSVYSDVYSTIEELSELPDPFDEPSAASSPRPSRSRTATLKASSNSSIPTYHHSRTTSAVSTATVKATCHQKTKSMTSLAEARSSPPRATAASMQMLQMLPPDMPPPLPPRSSKCRPPAMPPYSSALVRAVQEIAQPISR